MAINSRNQGFALLIAVIFSSVMLAFALLIGTLAYKQSVLANTAFESQFAFYVADSAMECLLKVDQDPSNPMAYGAAPPDIFCGGVPQETKNADNTNPEYTLFRYRFEFDPVPGSNREYCADVTVYKYQTRRPPPSNRVAYLFSQGYTTSCDNVGTSATYSSRGIQGSY